MARGVGMGVGKSRIGFFFFCIYTEEDVCCIPRFKMPILRYL